MEERKFPITKCPDCNSRVFMVQQRISGTGEYYVDMQTGEVDCSELYSNLTHKNIGKYAVCTGCGRKLFEIDDNLQVGKLM